MLSAKVESLALAHVMPTFVTPALSLCSKPFTDGVTSPALKVVLCVEGVVGTIYVNVGAIA